jgi:citrate lyase subunit beta / citryl-CoA lyase
VNYEPFLPPSPIREGEAEKRRSKMILRSFLFVPGNRVDRIEKAFASPADAVIIDLEDAVAPSEKESVRKQVGVFLEKANRKNIFIRINSVKTPFFTKDLETIAQASVQGIVIPKSDDPEAFRKVDLKLGELERQRSVPEGRIRLIPQLESALGLSKAQEIGASTRRMLGLAFGAGDLTLDLGAKLTQTGEELFYARSHLVFASRLAGVYAIDAPYMIDVKDIEGLTAEARRSRQLGLRGKFCIHPSQIGAVNEIFSPTSDEMDRARKIIEAYDRATGKGEGAIALEGEFIDPPVYEMAKQVLDAAKEYGL